MSPATVWLPEIRHCVEAWDEAASPPTQPLWCGICQHYLFDVVGQVLEAI